MSKRTNYFAYYLTSCSIVVALLVVACTSAAKSAENLPEYFGVYLVTSRGVQEIPEKNQKVTSALAAFMPSLAQSLKDADSHVPKALDEVRQSFQAFFDSCQPVGNKPTFIVFHDLIKPEMFGMVPLIQRQLKSGPPVDIGISPVQGKQSMFRIAPKAPLSPGVYVFRATGEFGIVAYQSCYVVDVTVDDLVSDVKAELDKPSH